MSVTHIFLTSFGPTYYDSTFGALIVLVSLLLLINVAILIPTECKIRAGNQRATSKFQCCRITPFVTAILLCAYPVILVAYNKIGLATSILALLVLSIGSFLIGVSFFSPPFRRPSCSGPDATELSDSSRSESSDPFISALPPGEATSCALTNAVADTNKLHANIPSAEQSTARRRRASPSIQAFIESRRPLPLTPSVPGFSLFSLYIILLTLGSILAPFLAVDMGFCLHPLDIHTAMTRRFTTAPCDHKDHPLYAARPFCHTYTIVGDTPDQLITTAHVVGKAAKTSGGVGWVEWRAVAHANSNQNASGAPQHEYLTWRRTPGAVVRAPHHKEDIRAVVSATIGGLEAACAAAAADDAAAAAAGRTPRALGSLVVEYRVGYATGIELSYTSAGAAAGDVYAATVAAMNTAAAVATSGPDGSLLVSPPGSHSAMLSAATTHVSPSFYARPLCAAVAAGTPLRFVEGGDLSKDSRGAGVSRNVVRATLRDWESPWSPGDSVPFIAGQAAPSAAPSASSAGTMRALAVSSGPAFAVLGGDLAYENAIRNCYRCYDEFFIHLRRHLSSSLQDADVLAGVPVEIPYVPVIGNHEAGGFPQTGPGGAPFYMPYLHYPNRSVAYYATCVRRATATDAGVGFVVLDSDVTIPAADPAQMEMLTRALLGVGRRRAADAASLADAQAGARAQQHRHADGRLHGRLRTALIDDDVDVRGGRGAPAVPRSTHRYRGNRAVDTATHHGHAASHRAATAAGDGAGRYGGSGAARDAALDRLAAVVDCVEGTGPAGPAGRGAWIPLYHVPMYPGSRELSGRNVAATRAAFASVFDSARIGVAFEHHDHVRKQSFAIRDGKVVPQTTVAAPTVAAAAGGNPGALRARAAVASAAADVTPLACGGSSLPSGTAAADGVLRGGTVYFGDGAWGTTTRPKGDERSYLAYRDRASHAYTVDVLTSAGAQRSVRATTVSEDGVILNCAVVEV